MEQLTLYDIIQLYSDHVDEINVVWTEMGDQTTLMIATLEWARRNGREIEVVDSKQSDKA